MRKPLERGVMAVSDDFLDFVLEQLSSWGQVTARKMFGGAGLYRDGKMFGLIADDVAYLKVDRSNRDRFLQAGSKPFRPYPERATVMPYYEIPPDILEDTETLVEWAKQSLVIARKAK
jgi:DNA transformation protein